MRSLHTPKQERIIPMVTTPKTSKFYLRLSLHEIQAQQTILLQVMFSKVFVCLQGVSLSRGNSVWGISFWGISARGGLYPGVLCPGALYGGRSSVQAGLCQGNPPYGKERSHPTGMHSCYPKVNCTMGYFL